MKTTYSSSISFLPKPATLHGLVGLRTTQAPNIQNESLTRNLGLFALFRSIFEPPKTLSFFSVCSAREVSVCSAREVYGQATAQITSELHSWICFVGFHPTPSPRMGLTRARLSEKPQLFKKTNPSAPHARQNTLAKTCEKNRTTAIQRGRTSRELVGEPYANANTLSCTKPTAFSPTLSVRYVGGGANNSTSMYPEILGKARELVAAM